MAGTRREAGGPNQPESYAAMGPGASSIGRWSPLPPAHFFLPPMALAAAAIAFFSSCCFFLNSMSSSVCSFCLPWAFFAMTAFCALFDVPTGILLHSSSPWERRASPSLPAMCGWPLSWRRALLEPKWLRTLAT
mmetsp:Transcript_4478/g.3458  ORF Transcript_4478/g.3458 Transcript_4478/m.3458 type:complete len:134 (-) Transcript_4478:9-410(-)